MAKKSVTARWRRPSRNVFQNILWEMIMSEVVLTRFAFISSLDLDGLEMKINDLLKNFEKKHEGIDTYTEIENN